MNGRLLTLGISHKTAPVALRERVTRRQVTAERAVAASLAAGLLCPEETRR